MALPEETREKRRPRRVRRRAVLVGVAVLLAAGLAVLPHVRVCRGMTLLHLTSSGGESIVCPELRPRGPRKTRARATRVVLARLLLGLEANVNARDVDGWTPLHWAAWAGDTRVASLLLSHGADPLARAKPMSLGMATTDVLAAGSVDLWEGRAKRAAGTPLEVAARFDQAGVVQVLLDAGVPPDARDKRGQTALHGAAAEDDRPAAQVLLDHHADVNARDDDGWTPLHYAAFRGRAEMAKLLLARGAQVSPAATREKRLIAAPMLLMYDKGITPLGLAAGSDAPTAEVLIAAGADLDVRTNRQGPTVRELAKKDAALAAAIRRYQGRKPASLSAGPSR